MLGGRWGEFGRLGEHRYDNSAEIGTRALVDTLHAAQPTSALVHEPLSQVRDCQVGRVPTFVERPQLRPLTSCNPLP
jgi:hypothetical protein